MDLNCNSQDRVFRRRFPVPVLAAWLLLVTVSLLPGQERYLTSGHPDALVLLPAPPAPGSAEEAADLASARAVFLGRSPAEEARAFKDATLAFSLYGPAIGPVFDLTKLPKTKALLEKMKLDIGEAVDGPKRHWKRQRPYEMDPALALGKPERNYGYPSGHSTRGTVYAMILAELFPEKREAILSIGRDIGWDRVVIGKHFPTDIYAGRVLGKAIVRELLASLAFQRDLADAKAEVLAAQDGSVRTQAPSPAEALAR